MKNIIRTAIVAIVILFTGITASAKSSNVFNKISEMDGVTSIYISKAMMSMFGSNIHQGVRGVEISKIASSLNSIEIISVEEKALIKKIKPLINTLAEDKTFEVLAKIKEDGENVTIYGEPNGKVLSRLVLVVEEEDELVIIYMTGDIPLDKISALTK